MKTKNEIKIITTIIIANVSNLLNFTVCLPFFNERILDKLVKYLARILRLRSGWFEGW